MVRAGSLIYDGLQLLNSPGLHRNEPFMYIFQAMRQHCCNETPFALSILSCDSSLPKGRYETSYREPLFRASCFAVDPNPPQDTKFGDYALSSCSPILALFMSSIDLNLGFNNCIRAKVS